MKKKHLIPLIIAVILLTVDFSYIRAHSFTVHKWSSYPENRTKIIADFLNDYELVGMSKKEVIELLGKSDNGAGYFNLENRLVYYLGPERGLISIDSEWLVIDFRDGLVSEYFLTTD